MKKQLLLSVAVLLLLFVSCKPNLKVKSATIDFNAKTVRVVVKNNGSRDAKAHLTYIEINQVGIANSAKPQSQYSAHVNSIKAGEVWDSGPIRLQQFSSPRNLDLLSLTEANLVVRADAKNYVAESNENDNVLDVNQ